MVLKVYCKDQVHPRLSGRNVSMCSGTLVTEQWTGLGLSEQLPANWAREWAGRQRVAGRDTRLETGDCQWSERLSEALTWGRTGDSEQWPEEAGHQWARLWGSEASDHQCRRLPVHGGRARLQSPGPGSRWRPLPSRPRPSGRPQPQVGGEAAGASPWRRLDSLRSKSPQTSKCSHCPEENFVAKVQRRLQNCYSFRVQQRRDMCSCSSLLDFRWAQVVSSINVMKSHPASTFLTCFSTGWQAVGLVCCHQTSGGSDEKWHPLPGQ